MNYKESTVTGTKWNRCAGVNIHNPLAPDVATVNFNEQEILLIDGKAIAIGNGNLYSVFDPASMIDLIDPDTLEPTGQQVPEGMVYLALFSKYMACAKARDDKTAGISGVSGTSGFSGDSGTSGLG